MESSYLLLLFALTSLLLVGASTRLLGLRTGGLPAALSRVLECAGLTIVLAILNLGIGFLLVLALRRLTGTFVSLYLNTDVVLVVMSALQAVALQWWMGERED